MRGASEPPFTDLLAKMSPVDLVLVEGFKREAHPKIEVHRVANGKSLIFPEDPQVVAIASDVPLKDVPLPQVSLDDVAAVADLVLAHAMPVEKMLRNA